MEAVPSSVLKVLFDGMIRTDAVSHRQVLQPKSVEWHGRTVSLDIATVVPRVYKGKTEKETAWELQYLGHIAQLARDGKILCYTSWEIEFEGWGRPRPNMEGTEYDPFRDVRFEKLTLPMPRTIVFGSHRPGDFKENKLEFLRSIRDKRFMELNCATGGNHPADTCHLWTAEVNGLDVFLTKDSKFKREFQKQHKVTTPVQIMLPWELCLFFVEHVHP